MTDAEFEALNEKWKKENQAREDIELERARSLFRGLEMDGEGRYIPSKPKRLE